MNNVTFIGTLFCLSLVIMSCSPEQSAEEKSGVIPEHQLEALEKAKEAEGLLQDMEQERQKQLEE